MPLGPQESLLVAEKVSILSVVCVVARRLTIPNLDLHRRIPFGHVLDSTDNRFRHGGGREMKCNSGQENPVDERFTAKVAGL